MEKFVLGNSGYDPTIRTENDRILARFGHLNIIVDAITELQETPPGSGIASIQAGAGITVDPSDPSNPIVSLTDTSTFLPLSGGTMDSEAVISFANSAGLKEGTTKGDGQGGIALMCSKGYEFKWESGVLYIMDQNGFVIRESLYNFNNVPSITDDSDIGYVVGSKWSTNDGTNYSCIDDTKGSAIWILQNGSGTYIPTLDVSVGVIPDILGTGFYTVVNGLATVIYTLQCDYSIEYGTDFRIDLPIGPVMEFNSMYDAKCSVSQSIGDTVNTKITQSYSLPNTRSIRCKFYVTTGEINQFVNYTITIAYFINKSK